MSFPDSDFQGLQQRVNKYHEILSNTQNYRRVWHEQLKPAIIEQLNKSIEATKLPAKVETRSNISNLEAVVLNLGNVKSGLEEIISEGLSRDLVKQNGSLVYQQLFNGKVLVLINYPFIEKYGQPQPPKTIAIYRPEEIKEPFVLRHIETFISEITAWEDYDDDAPEPNQRIGFKFNFEEKAKEATK